MNTELTVTQQITIWILPILFAITVHEAAHAWVAFRLGDDTAHRQGRVTLNPLKHIDPIGTVVLPILLLAIGGFIFGWAKPVPIEWHNLKKPRRDVALVAAAGPLANLLMAMIWVLIAKIGFLWYQQFEPAIFLIYTGQAGILINCFLMVLNMLPILPLDGGRVLHSLLPPQLAILFSKSEPYGLFILLALLATGLLGIVLLPLVHLSYQQMMQLAGLL